MDNNHHKIRLVTIKPNPKINKVGLIFFWYLSILERKYFRTPDFSLGQTSYTIISS